MFRSAGVSEALENFIVLLQLMQQHDVGLNLRGTTTHFLKKRIQSGGYEASLGRTNKRLHR